MAEQKKKESSLDRVKQFFGGETGKAETAIRDRKKQNEEALRAIDDSAAANGEERPGYSRKWVE